MQAKPTISQFLSFFLTADIQAMLPTEELGEIIKIDPSHIVPIFDLSPAVMGVYNHRGEVLWVVDLSSLLELEPLYKQNYYYSYNVLLISKNDKILGLAVRQVGHLVLCKTGQIRRNTLHELTPKLSFCLAGEKRTAQGQTILALDGDRIVELLTQESDKS
ncbi:Chemotaxis signal transduction protein [Hyella patelloides LEGE 07179]|uniref:Chemotaxis signal transduction protein n=1 Tax=Hyella patelloides LEGE 07179 TaxID=945734 RepID=A0A563W3D9_9CYAN|nr:chemotaxis protein CheW [Hyella patelloides]VEP18053.1 Chemotaxis signal transduction protein [Hyella patelloides LEGE 07179]